MKKTILITLIASLAVIAAGAAAVFYITLPPVTQQITPGEAYIIVKIAGPLPGATLALNAPARISASAIGQSDLRRLELWADGKLVGVKDVPDKARVRTFNTSWDWIPVQEGNTTLVVRAFDAANHIAMSNAVRVNTSTSPVVRHILQGGDTLDSLALQNNTTAEAIVAANPGFKASDILPEGAGIYLPAKAAPQPGSDGSVPKTPPPAPPTNGPGGVQTDLLYNNIIPGNAPVKMANGDTPDKFNFWAIKNAGGIWNTPAKPFPYTTQPAFDATVKNCGAILRMQPPEIPGVDVQTFLLYRLDPLSTSYTLLVALPGSGKLVEGYLDESLYGKFSYYVVALMAPDQQPITSAVVDIEVTDKACNKGQWSSLVVTQGKLTTSDSMGGGVYCYMTLNDTPWARIPQKEGTTIPFMVGSAYDLKPYMPDIIMLPLPDTINISLECWGINGGQAISLGTGTGSFSTGGPAAVDIIGSGFHATIVFDRGAPVPGQQVAPSALTPPTALRVITSRQDCMSHIDPADANSSQNPCDYMYDPGLVYFAYEWSPAACPAGSPTCPQDSLVRGFHIYAVHDDGSIYRFDDNSLDRKQFEDLSPRSGNACFVVRSYAMNPFMESANSNIACAPGSATRKTKETPVNLYTETVNNLTYNGCGPFAPQSAGVTNSFAQSNGPVNAGYNYFNYLFNPTPFFSCKVTNDHFSRAVIEFDTGGGRGQPSDIQKAVLSFDRTTPAACGATLNVVTQMIGDDISSYTPLLTINPGSFSLDVTDIINRNFNGPYDGTFMINSNYENANALDNKQCSETFTNFTLMLTEPN